jgi:hypothetical protein
MFNKKEQEIIELELNLEIYQSHLEFQLKEKEKVNLKIGTLKNHLKSVENKITDIHLKILETETKIKAKK